MQANKKFDADNAVDKIIKELHDNLVQKNNFLEEKNRIAAAKRKLDRDEEAVKNKCGENKRKREFLLNQLRVIEAEQEDDVKNYLLIYNFI